MKVTFRQLQHNQAARFAPSVLILLALATQYVPPAPLEVRRLWQDRADAAHAWLASIQMQAVDAPNALLENIAVRAAMSVTFVSRGRLPLLLAKLLLAQVVLQALIPWMALPCVLTALRVNRKPWSPKTFAIFVPSAPTPVKNQPRVYFARPVLFHRRLNLPLAPHARQESFRPMMDLDFAPTVHLEPFLPQAKLSVRIAIRAHMLLQLVQVLVQTAWPGHILLQLPAQLMHAQPVRSESTKTKQRKLHASTAY